MNNATAQVEREENKVVKATRGHMYGQCFGPSTLPQEDLLGVGLEVVVIEVSAAQVQALHESWSAALHRAICLPSRN